jgi:inosine-uridine nucleoside N-ribohydrolase
MPCASAPSASAADLLRELLCARSIDCVIALGPLSNLGPLAAEHPDWFRGIPVLWMGGSLSGGNASAAAEFNCWADPRAAALLLGAGVDVWVIGLDATRGVVLRQGDIEALDLGRGPRGAFLAAVLAHLVDAEERQTGRGTAVLHDPTALAAAFAPELFRWERRCLGVCVDEGPERGRLADSPGGPEVRWASRVDRARLVPEIAARLRAWARAGDARA